MKKILVILSCISKANGVSAYALNYLKKINKEKYHMDFVVVKKGDQEIQKQFLENESEVYEIIRENESFFKYLKRIINFMKKNSTKYDIIHSHVYNFGAIFLMCAKKYGIPVRILHSHATVSSDSLLKRIINYFLIPIAKKNSTNFFACSELAGKFLFKKKEFIVINNAIDIDKYLFVEKKRSEIRKKLGLEDCFVIGNIGRLCKQKNQHFLIKVFKMIHDENSKARLIIIGSGILEEKLKLYVKKCNLENEVIFFGARNDVEEFYNAMDVFVLPSLYEGLPVVGIEAQCNGLPCIFSDSITKEVKINENAIFLPLKENISKWKETINKYQYKTRITDNINFNKYKIEEEAKKIEKIYDELMKKEESI